jgi:hypothetical protein
VAPELAVTPSSARLGDVIEITGRYFASGCNDSGPGRVPPQRAIGIVAIQGGTQVLLDRLDAASDYTFSVRVSVPAGLKPGTVTVAPVEGPGRTSFVVAGDSGNSVSLPTILEGGYGQPPPTVIRFRRGVAVGLLVGLVLSASVIVVVAIRTARSRRALLPARRSISRSQRESLP